MAGVTIEPALVNAVLALAGSLASVAGLGWWLQGRFQNVENVAREVERTSRVLLDVHEAQDQKRHEENLSRFEKISVEIARLQPRSSR